MPQFNVISNQEHAKLKAIQQENTGIIKKELNRLKLKEDNINSRAQNAERMILLNQSYHDRQKKYLILIMIFVLTFAVCAVVIFTQQRLGIKKTTLDIVLIVTIVIGIVSAYYTYDDILSRDKIQFSKLNMDHVSIIDPDKIKDRIQDAKKNEGKVVSTETTGCYGASCCDHGSRDQIPAGQTGTYWDGSKCIRST